MPLHCLRNCRSYFIETACLYDLLKFACISQVRCNELLLGDLRLFVVLACKSDETCGEIDLPPSLRKITLVVEGRRARTSTHLLREPQKVRLGSKEEERSSILQRKALIRRLFTTRNLISARPS